MSNEMVGALVMKHLPPDPCKADSRFHMTSFKVAFPSLIKGSKRPYTGIAPIKL
jgi:hypothetical protein